MEVLPPVLIQTLRIRYELYSFSEKKEFEHTVTLFEVDLYCYGYCYYF